MNFFQKFVFWSILFCFPAFALASGLGGFTTHTIGSDFWETGLGKMNFNGDNDGSLGNYEKVTAEEYEGLVLKIQELSDLLSGSGCPDKGVLVWNQATSQWECKIIDTNGGNNGENGGNGGDGNNGNNGNVGGDDGDWVIDGDDMYAGVSGNIGIGTDTPLAGFHILSEVSGAVRIETAPTNTTGSTQVDLYNDTATHWAFGVNSSAHPTNPGDGYVWGYQAEDFRFGVQGKEILKLTAAGKVQVPSLKGCLSVYTDANGVLTCGTDGSGSAGGKNCENDGEVLKWINTAEGTDPELYEWVCSEDETGGTDSLAMGFCFVPENFRQNTQWIQNSGPTFHKTGSDPLKNATFFKGIDEYDGSDCALTCMDGYVWDGNRGICAKQKRMCDSGEFLVGFDTKGAVLCQDASVLAGGSSSGLGACSSATGIQSLCVGDLKSPLVNPTNPQAPENCKDTNDIQFFVQDSRDNMMYQALSVGKDCWMADNLKFNPGNGKRLCMTSGPNQGCALGGLYSFENILGNGVTVNDFDFTYYQNQYFAGTGNPRTPPVKGICMDGWHIPTKGELETLKVYLGSQPDVSEDFNAHQEGGHGYYESPDWKFWEMSDKYWAAYKNRWSSGMSTIESLAVLETGDGNGTEVFEVKTLVSKNGVPPQSPYNPDLEANAVRCVADRKTVKYPCSGSLPLGAEFWDWKAGSSPYTMNASTRSIEGYAPNYSQEMNRNDLQCDWKCKNAEYGYTYNRSRGICESDTPFCAKPPANAAYTNPGGEWKDEKGWWQRAVAGINYANVSTRNMKNSGCEWSCWAGYEKNGNTCVRIASNKIPCGYLPDNARWVGDGYYETKNEGRWKPYYAPEETDDDSCAYACDGSRYTFSGNDSLGCQ